MSPTLWLGIRVMGMLSLLISSFPDGDGDSLFSCWSNTVVEDSGPSDRYRGNIVSSNVNTNSKIRTPYVLVRFGFPKFG